MGYADLGTATVRRRLPSHVLVGGEPAVQVSSADVQDLRQLVDLHKFVAIALGVTAAGVLLSYAGHLAINAGKR